MKKYEIIKAKIQDYDFFIMCLSYDNILNYINEIERSFDSSIFCKIIIDQLLVTGNNENRYLECSLKNSKFDLTTTKIKKPNNEISRLSLQILRSFPGELENSILPQSQKDMILYNVNE